MTEQERRGAEARKRRLALGLGLREFAKLVDVFPSAVSRMQRGLVDPTPLEKWLDELEADRAELV